MSKKSKRKKHFGIITGCILFILGMTGGFATYHIQRYIYGSNFSVINEDEPFLYIPSNSTFDDVCALLEEAGLQDVASFRRVAGRMNYPNKIKAGRYRLTDGMSNIELVRMLRSGRQIPVKVIFNNIRLNTQLAGAVTPTIEADSASIIALLTDSA